MAEIYINADDLNHFIAEYGKIDKSFGIKNIYEKGNRKICNFHLKGKECKVTFYIKKNTVNMIPEGKNKDEANLLIEYIKSKGMSTDAESQTVVFKFEEKMLQRMIEYFNEERIGLIKSVQVAENRFKFTGYNRDEVTLSFYPQKQKAMIQGKPLQAFCIIATYLSELDDFNFDEIVELNNNFSGGTTASSIIRDEMKEKLGNAYTYLSEALKKSISGSISLLKAKIYCEDYKGCLAGAFVGLEGYLKEILKNKYHYKLQKTNTFSMFHIDRETEKCPIDLKSDITEKEKIELKKLYSLYSDKRNVYLHATIDSSLTAIIPNIKDANSLSNEIIDTIKNSYDVFFNK